MYIAIDIGTTNSRLKIFDNTLIASYSRHFGIKDIAIKNSMTIEDFVKDFIYSSIDNAKIMLKDIEYIVASGMITSNIGLYQVPYVLCPVNIEDISKGVAKLHYNWLGSIPFYLIPGVKVVENGYIDIMRGEESEILGIMDYYKIEKKSIIILPGSHTKFVEISGDGYIVNFRTTMTGELFFVLSQNTVLHNSINENLIESISSQYFIDGIKEAQRKNFTSAIFSTRIKGLFNEANSNECASFLLGIIIHNDLIDMSFIKNELDIYICGSEHLKEGYKLALEYLGVNSNRINLVEKNLSDVLALTGANKVVEAIKN